MDTTTPQPTVADGWTRKRRYHHGNLAPSALARGRHGMLTVASPRRALETALGARRDPDRATYLASAIHGLALARIDGLTGPDTERALARALRVPRG